MSQPKPLSRPEVDRIFQATRRLIRSNPVRFTQTGKDLDADFGHKQCWLDAVWQVNESRTSTHRLQPDGTPYSTFTDEEIAAEWALWEAAWESGNPIVREVVHVELLREAYEMPKCDDSRYVKLVARGHEAISRHLVPDVWNATAALPSEQSCARLVLMSWILCDHHSSDPPTQYSEFQEWRAQSMLDSKENRLLGREFTIDPEWPQITPDFGPSFIELRLGSNPSPTWQAALARAVEVLAASERYSGSDPLKDPNKPSVQKKERKKSSPGRKSIDGLTADQLIGYYDQWRAVRQTRPITRLEFEDELDLGFKKGFIERGQKAKARRDRSKG